MRKIGKNLKYCLGVIKEDKESKSIEKTLKREWKRFDMKYQ